MTQSSEDFRKRLAELVGSNASAFARNYELTQSAMCQYLSGERAPGYDFFLKLALRDVDLVWLLTGRKGRQRVEPRLPGDAYKKSQHVAVIVSDLPEVDAKDILEIAELLVEQRRRRKRFEDRLSQGRR